MRIRSLKFAVLLLLLIWASACAHLPEYAKPRTIQNDEIREGLLNAFTYRQLTREDFRAASLPENMSPHGKGINAQSVITIRATADSNVRIIRRQPLLDQVNYVGTLDHLAFEAVMIPGNSWWNPKINAAMAGYVLQHEQIHFALTELAARKLTRDSRKWASNLSVIKETPERVYSEIAQQIKGMINSALEANKKRHLKFDEETSLFYSPSWQAWWLEMVEKELRQTESATNLRMGQAFSDDEMGGSLS